MDFDEDKNLVEKAQADQKAFALIYQKYSEKVFNYFWYRLNHDTEMAQDLMQDVFVRALNNIHRFKEESFSYLSYLLKISHNLLIDHYKKPKNLSLENLEIDICDESPDKNIVGVEEDEEEKIQILWKGIDTLPLNEKDVLLLHYRKNLKINQIAKIKGKSENAIKLTLSRARKRLKDMYGLKTLPNLAEKKPQSSKKKFLF